jgi:uncharacterized protein YndB with AHSA1/START domain
MPQQSFVYVTYIRTTPEKLWEALTKPEFTREYWFGCYQESDWQPGSSWKLKISDGRLGDSGEVLESAPPKRLVLKWRNEFRPELHAEGYTRCTFDIEPEGELVKLTVTHEAERPSKLIDAVSGGWPAVLSSLKSMLETGKALPRPATRPADCGGSKDGVRA